MGATRASLIGGAANFTHAGYTSALADDGKFDIEGEYQDIVSAIYGLIDQVESDALVKIAGTPLTFDPATTPAALYPYLTPVFGVALPNGVDTPFAYAAPNGDVYTATCAVLTKMPDIVLSVTDSALGQAEWTGIIGDGLDSETANALYKIETGKAYAPIAIDRTKIPRGRYTMTYSWLNAGNPIIFEAEDKITISFEATLEAIKVQGRTRGFKLTKLAVMTKFTPVGISGTLIDSTAKFQGAGATHGRRLSDATHDLAITGPINITQKNAALKTAGFRFGNKVLRAGEIGLYSTVDPTAGAPGAILTFA